MSEGREPVSDNVEVVKAVNELINAQADQLWTISISIIVAEIFMIAHLILLHGIRIRKQFVKAFLILSVLFFAFSLLFGYASKGALIQAMITFSIVDKWTFPRLAELFNLLQLGSVTAGLAVFVVCFFFYSKELAGLLVREENK
jgi:hypothetical protein